MKKRKEGLFIHGAAVTPENDGEQTWPCQVHCTLLSSSHTRTLPLPSPLRSERIARGSVLCLSDVFSSVTGQRGREGGRRTKKKTKERHRKKYIFFLTFKGGGTEREGRGRGREGALRFLSPLTSRVWARVGVYSRRVGVRGYVCGRVCGRVCVCVSRSPARSPSPPSLTYSAGRRRAIANGVEEEERSVTHALPHQPPGGEKAVAAQTHRHRKRDAQTPLSYSSPINRDISCWMEQLSVVCGCGGIDCGGGSGSDSDGGW